VFYTCVIVTYELIYIDICFRMWKCNIPLW